MCWGEGVRSQESGVREPGQWPAARSEDAEGCGNHPGAVDSLGGAVKMWPTARGMDSQGAGYMVQRDGSKTPCLGDAARQWPTPNTQPEAPNVGGNRGDGKIRARVTEQSLGKLSKQWQTPKTPSGGNTSRGHDRKAEPLLDGQAKMWRTPDAPSGGGVRNRQGSCGEGHQLTIAEQAEHWPTPAARDGKRANGEAHLEAGTGRKHLDQLPNFVEYRFSPQDPTAESGRESSSDGPGSRRRLNPVFVSWLMGWPWHWTAPEPIACGRAVTEWWRSLAQWHLNTCFGGRGGWEGARSEDLGAGDDLTDRADLTDRTDLAAQTEN